ncbi:M16 family metallopeptidase [Roseateles oligotrophus]|uniref:Insulinase family protein n=1 Tax=Roseateles oligotrophus TaxID=1769250 RepID=A0ABT2YBV6_9BURK|nr:M16 family metallopeptidase [Roseateles oligotrophus]MCV2366635.1 insulinase family protein [Roseateles oligotrophus]
MQRTAPDRAIRHARTLLLVLAFAAQPAFAQPNSEPKPDGAGLKELRTLGGISEYRLSNGLQILLMPTPKHSLTRVTMTYRVGSRHEGPGEAGMAHLLEHVTFRGTQDAPDLAAEMQQMQVRWNGTTTMDRTNYFSWFNPDPSTLARVLKLEASRMRGARLSEQDFAKEKPIVLNEMGLRGGQIAQQLHQALQASAYRQHPYGRPVIGFTPDIEALSLQRLRGFYERHYQAHKAVLMISGAFDSAQALSAVVDAFGALPDSAQTSSSPEQEAPPEPPQQAPRLSTLHTSQTALAVAYRTPGMAHPDAPALMVLSQLLLGVSQRLMQDPAWPGRALLMNGMPISRDPNLLGLGLLLPNSASDQASARRELEQFEERWLNELGQFIDPQRMGDALVRRVAVGSAAQLKSQLQDPDAAAQLISHAIGAGDWRLPFKLLDALPELRAYDVRKVAANYVRAENRSVARGVTDASIRNAESGEAPRGLLAGLFAKAAEVQVVTDPSSGLEKIKSGGAMLGGQQSPAERFDADPAAIESRVQRLRLSSGMQLALLPKPSANEQVSLLLSLRWGSADEMAGQQGWRPLAAMLEDGAAKHSAADIQRLRQQLQADIRIQSGPQGLQLQLQTRKASLLPALELLRDLLRRPTLSDAAFERVRKATLANLEAAARATAGSVQDRLRRYLNQQQGLAPDAADYQQSAEELLQIWRGLDAQQVRDFHARFWSANQAQIAVVGNLPDQLSARLETLFGDWQGLAAPTFVRQRQAHRPVAGARFIAVSQQQAAEGAASVAMQQDLALTQQSIDYPALLLGTRLLAGDGASASGSRLAERLRQQDALSYNISANLRVPNHPADDAARFSLQASSAPASAFKVETALQEEITRLLSFGPSAAELERVRRQLLADRRQQRGQDAHLAAALLAHFDLDMNFISQQAAEDAALEAASPEQVLQALRRALRPRQWVVLINGVLSAEP